MVQQNIEKFFINRLIFSIKLSIDCGGLFAQIFATLITPVVDISISLLMGGAINGVVYNKSDYTVSYLVSQNKVLEEVEERLSTKLQGSVAEVKYTCIDNFEGVQLVKLVKVDPGKVEFSLLKDLQPNQHYISLFVHVEQETIVLIKNSQIKTSLDVCLKIRKDLSFKNMAEAQARQLAQEHLPKNVPVNQ